MAPVIPCFAAARPCATKTVRDQNVLKSRTFSDLTIDVSTLAAIKTTYDPKLEVLKRWVSAACDLEGPVSQHHTYIYIYVYTYIYIYVHTYMSTHRLGEDIGASEVIYVTPKHDNPYHGDPKYRPLNVGTPPYP